MDILGTQKLVPKSSPKMQSDHGPLQYMLKFKSFLRNSFANDSKLQIENERKPSDDAPKQPNAYSGSLHGVNLVTWKSAFGVQ